MTPVELKDLLDRYFQGKADAGEEKLIQEWYERIQNKDPDTMEGASINDPANAKRIESRLWSKLNPRPGKARGNKARFFVRVAAIFIMVCISGLGLYLVSGEATVEEKVVALQQGKILSDENFVKITNPGRMQKKVTLDDGSVVVLQAKSEIHYQKNFTPALREVHLSGEAFFDVKRDALRPFFVYTGEVVTKVLGTSFNIRAYTTDKEITVAVKRGKVSVYTAKDQQRASVRDDKHFILTPNQKVVYNRDNEKVSKQLVEVPEIILENPTLFTVSYAETPVTKILEAIGENYGVDIEFDKEALSGCILTTSMSDEGLYERIEVICRAINAEYTISNAVIFIKGRGCN